MGLFNGTENSGVTGTTVSSAPTAAPAANSGADMSKMADEFATSFAALQSHFQQMIDTMGPTMEAAFTKAFSSDAVSDTLYNSFASANYDSSSDLKVEEQIAAQEKAMAERAGDNGKYTLDELLAVQRGSEQDKFNQEFLKTLKDVQANTAKQNVSASVTGTQPAPDKESGFHIDPQTKALATGATKTTVNAGAEVAKGLGKTGISLGMEAARGTADLGIKTVTGLAGAIAQKDPSVLLDNMFGSLEKTGHRMVDKGVNGIRDTANNTVDAVDKGIDDTQNKVEKAGATDTTAGNSDKKYGTGPFKTSAPTSPEDIKDRLPPPGPGGNAYAAKEQSNLSRKVYADLPPFMERGNKAFEKIIETDFEHSDASGLFSRAGGAMSALGKSGLFAMAGASLATLAGAGLAIYDWWKGSSDQDEYMKKNLEHSNKELDKHKTSTGDSTFDKILELEKQSNELNHAIGEEQRSGSHLAGGFFTSLVGFDDYKSDKEAELMQKKAEVDTQVKLLRKWMNESRNMAAASLGKKSGTDVTTEELAQWEKAQKTKAAQAGIDINDTGAYRRFLREEFKKSQEAQKPQEQNKDGTKSPEQPKDKPAAGSTETKSQEQITAGTGVQNVTPVTPEMQKQMTQEATTAGVLAAFNSKEVQTMMTSSAQTAGAAVNTKLMGA